MKSCYDCQNIMSWREYGQEFIDCKLGKMDPEGLLDFEEQLKCAESCDSYTPTKQQG